MNYKTLHLDITSDGTAYLTFTRADKHNALNSQMIAELRQVTKDIQKHDARLVILTGEGKSFCAGADLNWMKEQFKANREQRIEQAQELAFMLKDLNQLPIPLIAVVNGPAYGGGLGIISVCDTAIALETAQFAFTEVKLGLIPATISPYVFAKIGMAKARQVFFSGSTFTAQEACQLGLIAKTVSEAEMQETIQNEIQTYLKAAPIAVQKAKQLLLTRSVQITNEEIKTTISQLADIWESEEAQEGISAFFEKRSPSWMKK